jgi:hypothetical protein
MMSLRSEGGERASLLRSLALLDGVLPSLQPLAAQYQEEADANLIALTIEKLLRSETVTFGETRELYFCASLAIARSEDWRLSGETVGALLEVRDATKGSMRVTAESEGKLAEYEAAERLHQQHLDDFHNPGAPLRGFFGPQKSGFLWAVLRDPTATVRAIQAFERHGMDTSEIKRLAARYKNPEDLEKDIRDAALLKELGEKEFSRQKGAANREAAARWMAKALCYLGVAVLVFWVLLHFMGRQ